MTQIGEEVIEKFEEYEGWAKHISDGCKHIKIDKTVISIPVRIPDCEKTGKLCRYDLCPLRSTPQRSGEHGNG